MQPLQLSFSLTNYSRFISRKGNKSFHALAKQALARDKNTCQFCGFQAAKFQEVVNLNQNYRDNKLENIVTACCFCAQCTFIESVGEQGYGGGTMLYFPEISQAELNAICHVLFFAVATNSIHKESAQAILQSIRMRSGIVDQILGEGMSDPANLGQLLLDYNANRREPALLQMLSKLRLLPSRGRFSKQIEYWAKQAGSVTK
ncbi:MAG: type IVB secretion system protein IcmJDotN [Gammaproteobacteria bacterium]|nr:type IVB secretion system protein IcmJDotN [Gammaproteobacteria bacterium]